MKSPVYIRPETCPRWCRLLEIGSVSHVTACDARIDASSAVVITAGAQPFDEVCAACAEILEPT
jgi:hypothetical protein